MREEEPFVYSVRGIIMITDEIKSELLKLRDEEYGRFQIKLLPTVPPESIIGVRTPELRRLAGTIVKRDDTGDFLSELPHRFFEENQLHAFVISESKDYESCIRQVRRFLPFVDNWATCDQMSPKIFRKHRPELLSEINGWISSGETYTVRFAVKMLMEHFLDGDFDVCFLQRAAAIKSDEYYVNMMIA